MKQYPAVTIFTGTYNPPIDIFRMSLKSILQQNYSGNVQHIVYDGRSSNSAVDLARSYGARVKIFRRSVDEGGSRLYSSLKEAAGELAVFIESDNILPDRDWLRRMVEPFGERGVFCTSSAYNSYEQDMDPLTKYFALIGSPDPTLYYLNKSDKIPITQKNYDKGDIFKETEWYWIVRFDRRSLPTMGDNGTMIRTDVLRKVVRKSKSYIHLDAFAELLDEGYDTYGIVKNSIIHVSRPNIFDQVRRRVAVKRAFSDEKRGKRIYHVMDWASPRDRRNLFKYIVFSLTFIEPLWVSIRGYMKVREPAWFLHPLMCFFMVVGYGWSEVMRYLAIIYSAMYDWYSVRRESQ